MISFRPYAAAATLAVAFAALAPTFAAAASPQQATLQGFVGTWTCVTRSSDNKSSSETDTDTMYGNWLRTDASYPAQGGAPAGTGVSFLGYDAKKGRWVITGVDTGDTYFIATSTSPDLNGSVWTDEYPADQGGTVIHLTPYTQYTLDSHGPDPKGTMTTSHTVCTKQ